MVLGGDPTTAPFFRWGNRGAEKFRKSPGHSWQGMNQAPAWRRPPCPCHWGSAPGGVEGVSLGRSSDGLSQDSQRVVRLFPPPGAPYPSIHLSNQSEACMARTSPPPQRGSSAVWNWS